MNRQLQTTTHYLHGKCSFWDDVSTVLFRVCCSRPSVSSSTNGSAASSPVSGRTATHTATHAAS